MLAPFTTLSFIPPRSSSPCVFVSSYTFLHPSLFIPLPLVVFFHERSPPPANFSSARENLIATEGESRTPRIIQKGTTAGEDFFFCLRIFLYLPLPVIFNTRPVPSISKHDLRKKFESQPKRYTDYDNRGRFELDRRANLFSIGSLRK